MTKQLIWIIVLAVILGGAYLWSSGQSERAWGPRMMMGTGIDRHFIEEMIPHHEGAIAMAELALERSKRAEVLSLATDIISAQTKEINDMRTWYQRWFGVDVPVGSSMMRGMGSGMMGHMQGVEGDLDALIAAPNFDTEFLSQMIVHHEMAVMMARMLSAGTRRSEMQTLAENIITSQVREIGMMQDWLSQW